MYLKKEKKIMMTCHENMEILTFKSPGHRIYFPFSSFRFKFA